MDEIDCANFFDRFDDLIDFPPEDDDKFENVVPDGDFMNSGDLPITWNDELPNPDAFLSKNAAADLSSEVYVPYEDIVQLEWLSTFIEDSYSDAGLNLVKESLCPNKGKFQTTSPVYVLESSSSSSSNSTISSSSFGKNPDAIPLCGPQRARSKRPRPASFNPRPPGTVFPESDNFAESNHPPPKKVSELSGQDQENKKKKKKKEKDHNPMKKTGEDALDHQAAVRKCLHCEITKTPQWRAGPMGPKTLCNACGVRYKSGRLFPEYRPAASPTFVPSVHSNSHKKVVEMRNKASCGSILNAEESVSNENSKNNA